VTLRIRAGELADVPLIAELIRGLSVYEKLEGQVTMTEEKLTNALFGERRYAETLIAEDGGAPVGFALFFHNFSTFLAQPGIYLEDLFVLPEHRGRGIGKSLLVELARVAVDRGCGRLEWAVLDWNRDAIGFYERLGAKPNTEWTTYRVSAEALHALAGE
jgi:GNAT superfamily N-acetyltransferase